LITAVGVAFRPIALAENSTRVYEHGGQAPEPTTVPLGDTASMPPRTERSVLVRRVGVAVPTEPFGKMSISPYVELGTRFPKTYAAVGNAVAGGPGEGVTTGPLGVAVGDACELGAGVGVAPLGVGVAAPGVGVMCGLGEFPPPPLQPANRPAHTKRTATRSL
jgi:hypothetical protein